MIASAAVGVRYMVCVCVCVCLCFSLSIQCDPHHLSLAHSLCHTHIILLHLYICHTDTGSTGPALGSRNRIALCIAGRQSFVGQIEFHQLRCGTQCTNGRCRTDGRLLYHSCTRWYRSRSRRTGGDGRSRSRLCIAPTIWSDIATSHGPQNSCQSQLQFHHGCVDIQYSTVGVAPGDVVPRHRVWVCVCGCGWLVVCACLCVRALLLLFLVCVCAGLLCRWYSRRLSAHLLLPLVCVYVWIGFVGTA
jgi:hypothetical protein